MDLTKECLKAVKRSRMTLLNEEPFYGVIARRLKLVICYEYNGRPVPTAATDGRHMFVNPEYFMSLSEMERNSLVFHETLHVVLAHHLRRCGRNPKGWNESGDEAVNLMIKDRGWKISDQWLCDVQYRGWSTERIFAHKYPDGGGDDSGGDDPRITEPGVGDPGCGDGGESGNDEQGDAGSGDGDNKDKGDGPGGDQVGAEGEVWDAVNENGDALTDDEMAAEQRNLAKDIEQARNVQRSAGDAETAQFERAVNEIVSPSAGWQSMLASKWSQYGVPDGTTWRRFDRRAASCGLWMPGKDKSGINLLYIGFDVSWSIMQSECDAFVSHINTLREDTPCQKIVVVPFNSTVLTDQVVEIYPGDDVPSKFIVGGGTKFAPVFNWINRQEDNPDAVIMFTDLGSTAYGEDPDYGVTWASTEPVYERGTYSNKPPFGDVIEIDVSNG
jgi:predicted metal-dependent peptidase